MTTPVKKLPYHDASQVAGVGHRDRLFTAGLFILLLHGVIILGVTFSTGDSHTRDGPTVAVTLVQSRSVKAPDNANYIAQANQRGQGNTRDAVRPAAPVSNPAPAERDGELNGHDNANQAARTRTSGPQRRPRAGRSPAERLLTTSAGRRLKAASGSARARAARSPRLLVARLLTPSAAAADPTIDKMRAPDDNPRDRAISVDTRKSRFATYLNKWRQQVTRIGNLNYPSAIRKKKLSGRLRLQVALNADGSIHALTLVAPSKHAALNAAALTIVRSGAPYAPFPESISKDTDVLRFVYEWRFIDGHLAGG